MRKNTFELVFLCTVFAAIALFGGGFSAESKASSSLILLPVRHRAVFLK